MAIQGGILRSVLSEVITMVTGLCVTRSVSLISCASASTDRITPAILRKDPETMS